MKKTLFIIITAIVFMACGSEAEKSSDADSTAAINSTTPPPVSDSTKVKPGGTADTSEMGTMMGDTSTAMADSINN